MIDSLISTLGSNIREEDLNVERVLDSSVC